MQKASYFEFENLYSPRNASSLWKPEGKMHVIQKCLQHWTQSHATLAITLARQHRGLKGERVPPPIYYTGYTRREIVNI